MNEKINDSLDSNDIELISIEELITKLKNKEFFVDSYQRGYKWTRQNVEDLLNDINEFEPREQTIKDFKEYISKFDENEKSIEEYQAYIKKFNQDFYCLQPIVVRKKGDSKWELIDGQQRITTIFIILSILEEDKFKIDYQTRPKSAVFLKDMIETNKIKKSIDKDIELKNLDEYIEKQWKNFTSEHSEFDNIDNFHFFSAYLTGRKWFDNKNEELIKEFSKKLLEFTKVIWYEVEFKNESDDSRKIFSKLNSGKIQLTNAELIKALFLSKRKFGNNKIATELKQREIANEWDIIENSLKDHCFWWFINENLFNTTPTRIDYLFDSMANKKNKDGQYFSFRYYYDLFKDESISVDKKIEKCWSDIKNKFIIFQEWFQERELYHLISFLKIAKNISPENIFKKYMVRTKSGFRLYIKDEIKRMFSDTDFGKLNYEEDKDYYVIKNILLLYNILTILKIDRIQRFDFIRYDSDSVKWSLEHIHAQNSKGLTTDEQWINWFSEAKTVLKELDENKHKELIDEIEELMSKLEKNDEHEQIEEKEILLRKVIEVFQDEKSNTLHDISNLALLDKDTNSSLNNALFPRKRQLIMKKEKEEGAFIPVCTRNVFLKFYSNDISQMFFWGYQDRKDYFDDMKDTLKEFGIAFKGEIVL